MHMNDIPSLAAITGQPMLLSGRKVKIKELLGVPLVFTAWHIGWSKYKNRRGERKECLTLQFWQNDEKCIVQTSSGVLLSQMREFEAAMPDATCFRATICKEEDYLVFR